MQSSSTVAFNGAEDILLDGYTHRVNVPIRLLQFVVVVVVVTSKNLPVKSHAPSSRPTFATDRAGSRSRLKSKRQSCIELTSNILESFAVPQRPRLSESGLNLSLPLSPPSSASSSSMLLLLLLCIFHAPVRKSAHNNKVVCLQATRYGRKLKHTR